MHKYGRPEIFNTDQASQSNSKRLHANLYYATPDEVYFAGLSTLTAAA